MKLKIGDRVHVKNWGRMLSSSPEILVRDNTVTRDLLARYACGDNRNYLEKKDSDNATYDVLRILDDGIVAITKILPPYFVSPIYLIYEDALVLTNPPKKMTASEIEEELGYRIEIIAEKEE